jgi:hypothetical protein
MLKLFIPWRLFFESLAKQPLRQRQRWLRWWLFDDRGVAFVPPVLMPEGDVPPGISLSLRDKQEWAILSAIAERKQARILH